MKPFNDNFFVMLSNIWSWWSNVSRSIKVIAPESLYYFAFFSFCCSSLLFVARLLRLFWFLQLTTSFSWSTMSAMYLRCEMRFLTHCFGFSWVFPFAFCCSRLLNFAGFGLKMPFVPYSGFVALFSLAANLSFSSVCLIHALETHFGSNVQRKMKNATKKKER